MSAKRRHSIGLLIVNDVPDSKEIIEKVKTDLYAMNMLVNVVYNKNADVIKKEVGNLTKLDSSIVEEIIVIIHTKRQPEMDVRKFVCNGVIMDIYTDIVNPLLCVKNFEEKLKLILVGGALCNTKLVPTDSKKSNLPYGSGKMVCIYSSENTKFITTAVSKLVEKKGNVSEAIKSKQITDLNCFALSSESICSTKIWRSQFIT